MRGIAVILAFLNYLNAFSCPFLPLDFHQALQFAQMVASTQLYPMGASARKESPFVGGQNL